MQAIQDLILKQELSLSITILIIIIASIVFALINRFESIFEYFDNRMFTKIKQVIEINKHTSDININKFVDEYIKQHIFYKCTKIKTNTNIINDILELSRTKHIDMIYFKRAYRFYKHSDISLEIRINKIDEFGKWFNFVYSAILIIISLLSLIFSLFYSANSQQAIIFFLLFTFLSIFGVFVLSQNDKLRAAKYIQNKIHKD